MKQSIALKESHFLTSPYRKLKHYIMMGLALASLICLDTIPLQLGQAQEQQAVPAETSSVETSVSLPFDRAQYLSPEN